MEERFVHALTALKNHSGWIVWNLFLAFIPLALSVWLFRKQFRSRSIVWWVAFLVFIAFLPNAPYLLTDIIHLIDAIRSDYSAWVITLVILPPHLLAIVAGFEAYVLSLINLGYYLHRQGLSRFILPVELITHVLCAVGVYLGRFPRLNSWDFVTQPDAVAKVTLDNLTSKRPVLVMAITFAIITVLYWVMKQVTLGLLLRARQTRADRIASKHNRKTDTDTPTSL
ncbi:MAG TPA: DUF1361 domain-containing protein [Allocoleopsis sp.]